jgi:outer membrane biosynthesis protein TonB
MAPFLKVLTAVLAAAGSVVALPLSTQSTQGGLVVRNINEVNTINVNIPANLTALNTSIPPTNDRKADEAKQKAAQVKEADDHRKAEEKKDQDEEDRKLREAMERIEERKKQEEEKKAAEKKAADEKAKTEAANKAKAKAISDTKKDIAMRAGTFGLISTIAGVIKGIFSIFGA